jgi:8-oxo-dGTP pyrophosphatase MutT (NUDIX family)
LSRHRIIVDMRELKAPRPWPKSGSEAGPNLFICKARFDILTNPRTGQSMKRTVLETPDWVNVVAMTPEQRLVVVRQYRFGIEDITTEIPGGVVDRGEAHEAAARRELREEAGHTAERWTYLGAVEPNPAFQNNLCHHWLAEDARATHVQELDSGEDIEVTTLSLDEVRGAIRSGAIRHALVLTALARVLDLRPA